MIDPRDIISVVNRRLNRVLTMAEAALPPDQFKAFRRFVLDEFGRKGLALDLATLMDER